MKAIWTAAAALAALAGCNQLGIGGGNANSSNANAAGNGSAGDKEGGNAAAPAADAGGGKLNEGGGATPAAANGATLDRAFIVGRWTDTEDCGDAIEFSQDGRFIAANGGTGLWNLEGDELTMSGSATATIRIVPVDRNTITVINPDRSLGRSTRC